MSAGSPAPAGWQAALAGLLPLWLVTLAVSAEGFPRPPVTPALALAALVLALLSGLFFLWKGWLTFALLLYSFIPLLFLPLFDEISTRYKTPFLLQCALLLSLGVLAYRGVLSRPARLAWLLLVLAAAATWVLAGHAAQSYWKMATELGYVRCMPDFQDCAPLTGRETPWWLLFWAP